MYKHPKIDFLAAYNSRTGNGLVKNSVLPSAIRERALIREGGSCKKGLLLNMIYGKDLYAY